MNGWPQGFSASTAVCGLKANGDPELAIIRSDRPCSAAGVFTLNRVQAAPVQLCRERLAANPGGIRSLVINSKNANAVTGAQGLQAARQLAALGGSEHEVLPMSTGVIGQPLPLERYVEGWQNCQPGVAGIEQVARALMTTDTYPKWVERDLEGTRWVAVAKGAGMIHPNMATLLGFVVSDADIDAAALQTALENANRSSFDCITVDGDSSTNDSLVVLANGASGRTPQGWQTCLTDMLEELARQVAFDGEGASHRVTLEISGLASDSQARQLGRTVLTSPLVKTAIAGKDANWGRILAAAGRAGVEFDPLQARLSWNGLLLLDQGAPTNPGSSAEEQAVQGAEVLLQLELGDGGGQATLWSCDLTHDYISINGDYRS